MNDEFLDLPINTRKIKKLKIERANQFYKVLLQSPYCKDISLYKIHNNSEYQVFEGSELIYFDVESELGQYKVNDIKRIERLCVLFFCSDDFTPSVFALRKNFPKVMHRSLMPNSFPASLCIYETPFEELKITWTPTAFLEDIRNWLSKTSRGELHQNEQQLEPFLLEYDGSVILPIDIKPEEILGCYLINNKTRDNKPVYQFIRAPQTQNNNIGLFVMQVKGEPQIHGIIDSLPRSFYELNNFLIKANINLIDDIIKFLKKIRGEKKEELNNRLIIDILLPKKRNSESEVSSTDRYVFCTIDNLKTIGEKLNIWQVFPGNGELGNIISPTQPEKNNLESLKVGLLRPYIEFDGVIAQLLNNVQKQSETNFFAIGMGALGSQVFINMARSGFGKWTLVDDDLMLPHNLARHALNVFSVGQHKVTKVSAYANYLLNDSTFSIPIISNILQERDTAKLEIINQQLEKSEIVIDMSASLAVSRMISNDERFKGKKKVSIFLNPTGTQLVILAEDFGKEYSLDYLEVCYYRELITNTDLKDHFENKLDAVRYSTSCRDTSNRITQDNVAAFSAISSKLIKNYTIQKNAIASVWKFEEQDLTVSKFDVHLSTQHQISKAGWQIVYDNILLNKIKVIREQKLPNETGGILIGSFDMERKKVFILDTIMPKDSLEFPTAFYRGIDGLKEELNKVGKITFNMLTYVGEWHSHPNNCSVKASADDKKLLEWLTKNISLEGLPAIMMIVGDGENHNIEIKTCN